jgi:hypothetical protein
MLALRLWMVFMLNLFGGAIHAADGVVELNTDGQCSYGGESLPEAVYTFTSDHKAEDVVDEIVEHTGLRRNFTISASDVSNAAAVTKGSERYLLYSQSFMEDVQQKTNSYWAGISIMAHEIGHHLQGHTLDKKGSRPTKEIEADEYSGFVLQKMGATLEEAQAAMNAIGSDVASSTHPAKKTRLAAIRAGWTKAQEQSGGGVSHPEQSPVAVPSQRPSTDDSVEVQVERTFTDGSRYKGQVKNGRFDGQGVWTSQSGDHYEGQFKDGHRHGQGVYVWPDGDRYEGQFKDGHIHGQGVYAYANGKRYEGQFKDGKRNGQGVLTLPDGSRYEGQFKDGKRNGQGTFMYPSGRYYEGQWKNNKKHGYGEYYNADDSFDFDGRWVDGEQVR